MAQTTSYIPQHHQGYFAHQQPGSAFVVVDQQPVQREVFPYRLQLNWILGFSIGKIILGSLLFITGIANVVIIRYDTQIAIGVWCGLTILANGIIGCILKCKPNKCLVGAFLGLSITSLVFSISMLSFYAVVLDYFVNIQLRYCYYYYYYPSCYGVYSYVKDQGIGVTSFLISLAVFELACSIGSVVVSCKAYSKCCNTCDCNDCDTCLGCCECDCHPLNLHQGNQSVLQSSHNYQHPQMPSVRPGPFQYNHNPAQLNMNAPPAYSTQPTQSNPCSGLVSFVINMPSYIFRDTSLSAVNVTVQPVHPSQQDPAGEPVRGAEQVQTVVVGGAQQNLPTSTWERVDA